MNLIPTSGPSNIPQKLVFFDRKSIDYSKRKPKPITYHIRLCNRCIVTEEGKDVSAWSALIIQEPQDVFNISSNDPRSAYMISGIEENQNHVKMRLIGVKESLEWITTNIDPSMFPIVEVTFISNDPYLVNLLKEWAPKWSATDFKFGKDGQIRPNDDILKLIADISTKVKLSASWISVKSPEMASLDMKVNELLDGIKQVKETEKKSNEGISDQAYARQSDTI